jgi:hypothetical protein
MFVIQFIYSFDDTFDNQLFAAYYSHILYVLCVKNTRGTFCVVGCRSLNVLSTSNKLVARAELSENLFTITIVNSQDKIVLVTRLSVYLRGIYTFMILWERI